MVSKAERQAAQIRAAVAAKAAALKRLAEKYADEYRVLYAEEAEARGVRPHGSQYPGGVRPRVLTLPEMMEEIRETGMLDGKPVKPYQLPLTREEIIAAQKRTRAEEMEIRGRLHTNIPPLPGSESENA